MRGISLAGVVFIMLVGVNQQCAGSSSLPINFTLAPGMYINFPLSQLYYALYNISCNVKDADNNVDQTNALKIASVYRPHEVFVDDKSYGTQQVMTLKTRMTGSTLLIKGVRESDDKITIENRDFTDSMAFSCIANLVEN